MGNALNNGIISAEPRADLARRAAKPSDRSADRWTQSTAAAAGGDRRAISEPFGFWLNESGCMAVCVDLRRIDRPPRAGDRLIGWRIYGAGVIVREFSYAEEGISSTIAGRPFEAGGHPIGEEMELVALVVGRYRPE